MKRLPRTSPQPRAERNGRGRGAAGWFLHRYGWRAYAIPVLIAVTVGVILQVGPPAASTAASPGEVAAVTTVVGGSTTTMTVTAPRMKSAAAASTPATSGVATVSAAPSTPVTGSPLGLTGPDPNGSYDDLAAAALPPGGAFVAQGKDTWHVVKGTTPPLGTGSKKYTFTIEVEDGIQTLQADQEFADLVDTALADSRSWIGSGSYTLQRIDTGTPSFRISLTSQLTVRGSALCGWEIKHEASCYARSAQRVAINDARWTRGAVSFDGDLGSYRVYAVNHEVGHALGYFHLPCAIDGGPAPVMMQQSWSTANNDLAPLNPQLIPMDGKVCKFNPYPYPHGPGTQ